MTGESRTCDSARSWTLNFSQWRVHSYDNREANMTKGKRGIVLSMQVSANMVTHTKIAIDGLPGDGDRRVVYEEHSVS